jgi:hypothetical protein
MRPKVNRRTVDLSGYPNLVVIYSGMRVNTLTGLKTLLGFGPQISKSVEAPPRWITAAREFVVVVTPPHTWGCANIGGTLNLLNLGHAPNLTGHGGRSFCETLEALVSGTKPTSGAGAWKRSMTTWLKTSAFFALPRCTQPQGRMFSARSRARQPGEPSTPVPVSEEEFYS